jgi:hypothetical protein
MTAEINKRGGGGLMQVANSYGASDNWLHGNTVDAQCYNIRNSMMHYFINRDNGFPLKEDIDCNTNPKGDHRPELRFDIDKRPVEKGIGFFAHYPEYLKPSSENLDPFNKVQFGSSLLPEKFYTGGVDAFWKNESLVKLATRPEVESLFEMTQQYYLEQRENLYKEQAEKVKGEKKLYEEQVEKWKREQQLLSV